MKKVIPIILILTMAFAFSVTALAEDDVVVLPPVDPGEWDADAETLENFDICLDTPVPPNVDVYVEMFDPEEIENDWPDYDDEMLAFVEDYKDSDAYDKTIVFNAIQYIAGVFFWDDVAQEHVFSETGGWITVTNKDWSINTVKAILQFFEYLKDDEVISEYRLITEFDFDPETGTLSFYVDDFGWWSVFFALIEKGVDPETAAKVANASSPQTSDNSIHAGIILLIVLSAATATVVISKKERIRNKA